MLTPHDWQVELELAPSVLDQLPASHDTHADSDVADTAVEYLPAAHLTHVSELGGAHVPAAHESGKTAVSVRGLSVAVVTVAWRLRAVKLSASSVSVAPVMSNVAVVYWDETGTTCAVVHSTSMASFVNRLLLQLMAVAATSLALRLYMKTQSR